MLVISDTNILGSFAAGNALPLLLQTTSDQCHGFALVVAFVVETQRRLTS